MGEHINRKNYNKQLSYAWEISIYSSYVPDKLTQQLEQKLPSVILIQSAGFIDMHS